MAAHAVDTRPQPLLTKAHIVATIAGLITALVMFGVIPQTMGDDIKRDADIVIGAVSTVVAVATPYVHTYFGRKDVTPLSDPQDNDGNKLMPVGSVEIVQADADAALAAANDLYVAESADQG